MSKKTKRKGRGESAIHERIRELRKGLGLSQEDFGSKVGAGKSAVSHWENGDYAPSRARMPKVAEILGVTIDELYAEAA